MFIQYLMHCDSISDSIKNYEIQIKIANRGAFCLYCQTQASSLTHKNGWSSVALNAIGLQQWQSMKLHCVQMQKLCQFVEYISQKCSLVNFQRMSNLFRLSATPVTYVITVPCKNRSFSTTTVVLKASTDIQGITVILCKLFVNSVGRLNSLFILRHPVLSVANV